MAHAWWTVREAEVEKFAGWVGEYEALPGLRIVLRDEERGQELDNWPREPHG
ncbi:hypothetical protein AB0P32_05025 [Streptomyces sp. NPDC085995]|uniref:hypothetical protein n=1 Tax=unclassified Streptomyces TaxID=2593676 RepID=UPI0034406873